MDILREKLDLFDEDVRKLQDKLRDQFDDIGVKRKQQGEVIMKFIDSMKKVLQYHENVLLVKNEKVFDEYEKNVKYQLDTCNEIANEVVSLQSGAADAIESETRNELNDEERLNLKYETLQDRFVSIQNDTPSPVFKANTCDIDALEKMSVGEFVKEPDGFTRLSLGLLTTDFYSRTDRDQADCFLTGICWENGVIAVTDRSNHNVKFFSEDGSFLSDVRFTDASPYGVCATSETIYAVTLPKVKQIHFVQLNDGRALSASYSHTAFGYSGICKGLYNNTLIVTVASNDANESKVDVIGYQGEVFRTININPVTRGPLFNFPRYVASNEGVIMVSDWKLNCLLFIYEPTGGILKEYRGTRENPLINPYSVSIDVDGNVYVLNGKDGSIHVLDIQCQLVDVISKTKELLDPRLLYCDKSSRRLAVTHGAGTVKTLYHRAPSTIPVAETHGQSQPGQSRPDQSRSGFCEDRLAPPQPAKGQRCSSPRF